MPDGLLEGGGVSQTFRQGVELRGREGWLRADRGVMDVVDADDVIGGAPAPFVVATDNGPCCGLARRRTLRWGVWPLADPLVDWEVLT
jgi:hypothetical protein